MHFAQLGQIAFMKLHLDARITLHPLENIEAATAAVAFDLVRAIRNPLKLLEHKPGHNELGVDNPGIANIGNPPVDDDARIENERLGSLKLLGKLDIRDKEAKIVLGLQKKR